MCLSPYFTSCHMVFNFQVRNHPVELSKCPMSKKSKFRNEEIFSSTWDHNRDSVARIKTMIPLTSPYLGSSYKYITPKLTEIINFIHDFYLEHTIIQQLTSNFQCCNEQKLNDVLMDSEVGFWGKKGRGIFMEDHIP